MKTARELIEERLSEALSNREIFDLVKEMDVDLASIIKLVSKPGSLSSEVNQRKLKSTLKDLDSGFNILLNNLPKK